MTPRGFNFRSLSALRAGGAACALVLLAAVGCSAPESQQPVEPPPVAAKATPLAQAAPALQDEPRGATPEDFSLDVTVLSGRDMPASLRVEDRTARYILAADGALYADAGPLVTQASRPGRARWLYQEQVSALWALCNQTGFGDPTNANGPANPDMIRGARGERVTIITVRASGRTWAFVRHSIGDAPTDPAAARIVRTLAALAWIPDYSPRDLAPERYDYGPDPYAAYRAVRAAETGR